MDVINLISKPPGLPDGNSFVLTPTGRGSTSSCRRCTARCSPGATGLLTVGEMPGVTLEEARLFTDPARGEVDMVFQFEHVQLDQGPTSKWDLRPLKLLDLKESFGRWQAGLGRRRLELACTGTTTTSRGRSRASATTASTA